MTGFNISHGQVYINSDHIKAGMSQYPLQREDITAITQVTDSESMPKGMRRAPDPFDVGPVSVFFNYRSQPVGGDRPAECSQEQGRAERIGRLGTVVVQISP